MTWKINPKNVWALPKGSLARSCSARSIYPLINNYEPYSAIEQSEKQILNVLI